MYLNKAMIYGNLTRDPEMRALPSGMQVCTFSLATNRMYTDRDGKRQESVDYHNITVFGKTAENCAKYLTKGASAYVEGSLRTNSWEKDGVKQYRTEIVADRVQFGPKSGNSNSINNSTPSADTRDGNAAAPVLPEYPEEDINPEDIPF
jgi:single-strand DNA-binding protein